MWRLICLWFAIICLQQSYTLDNGLALTPPMGWMTWERYRCITDCQKYPDECISEWLIRNTTDYMVSGGFKDAGYEYVTIDDCWMEKERDPVTKQLIADRKRFPSGMKALADYVHSKGLKFGIYEDYGTKTCAGYPGVIGHMELDANLFAKWGVDYVKLDGCNANANDMDKGYPEFGRLLNATGRPMVYSCEWPLYQQNSGIKPNFDFIKKHCNSWRNWGDIEDSLQSLNGIVDYFRRNQDRFRPHAGPGHWNDPDMLVIGNFGLSYEQSKVQMALWSILAAPLFMSTDLKNMRSEYREILTNRHVIAVDQDKLGIQGKHIRSNDKIETWTREISPTMNGMHSYAVAWVSRRDDGTPFEVKAKMTDFGLTHKNGYVVTDLFNDGHKVFEQVYHPNDDITIRVNPSGVIFYKFTPVGGKLVSE